MVLPASRIRRWCASGGIGEHERYHRALVDLQPPPTPTYATAGAADRHAHPAAHAYPLIYTDQLSQSRHQFWADPPELEAGPALNLAGMWKM